MNEVFTEDRQLPTWLSLTKIKLIPKNDITNMAKNYRPIECQNIMYKIYTGCINVHLQDHCENNSIITDQQAVCDCAEQLLINKMILMKSNIIVETNTRYGWIIKKPLILYPIHG